ncbi:MAG: DNA polymerase III subunit delta' [Paracoccaceae bacterium]
MSDELLEPDRVEGAPHPRETTVLLGQSAAEAAFLDAFNTGRLHHGWLITGPRGVGKATLAWRIARFLLAQPAEEGGGLFGEAPPAPDSLDIAPDHPVARRMAALSESRLFLLRRAVDEKKGKLKTVITVDEARRLKNFFSLSAAEGGRRVVIVDAADEMNPNAANALLKLLEEPPENAVLLLVAHQPSRLLPTIRSRCRELRLSTLGEADMAAALASAGMETEQTAALTALSGGSVGEAIRLANLDGLALYSEIVGLFAPLNRPRMLKLAESAVGKGAEARFDLMLRLFDLFLTRLARTGVAGPPAPEAAEGEAALMARLCPDAHAARTWAEAAQELGTRARQGKAVNLDPAALILDTVLRIDELAARLAAPQAHS